MNLFKLKQMELSQRVVLYYLLFCVIGAVGLGLGIAYASQQFLDTRSESKCLAMIGQAVPRVIIQTIQSDDQKLTQTLQQIHRDNQLLYACIVSKDGVYTTHTDQTMVGKKAGKQIGKRKSWGEFETLRFNDVNDINVCEYRAKLISVRQQDLGSLRLAVPEPTVWHTLFSSSEYIPLALLLPAIILGVGMFVLRKVTKPITDIESQLKELDLDSNLEEAQLHSVPYQSAASSGWNKLVSKFGKETNNPAEDEKLRDAVSNFRQNRVESILNSLPDGLALTDHSNRIKLANSAFFTMTHAEVSAPDSVIGQQIQQFLQSDSTDETEAETKQDENAFIREITKTVGTQERILRVARHRVGSSNDQQQIWSVRDITQQKLTEKMRDDFLDCATHELRTPLSNIRAYAETLALSDILDVEQQKEFCNTINSEATRLGRFIDDLLSISSVEAGSLSITRENVQVDRMMRDVVSKIQPTMQKKNIEFNVDMPQKELPEIFIDKDKLQVALVNLLGNAAKYTNEGGLVNVTIKLAQEQIIFSVADTGIGISKEDQPKLFDKFFRSDNEDVQNITGTGLGLSLANEIVRLHGGNIEIDSELGKGSTFTITIPVRKGGR